MSAKFVAECCSDQNSIWCLVASTNFVCNACKKWWL